jgi:hypothetical protein
MHAREQLRQGAVRGCVQELPGLQGVLGEKHEIEPGK